MVKYKWTVSGLGTKTVGTQNKCVLEADYNVVGTDLSYTSIVTGTQTFEIGSGVFVPYENLTNDLVVGWIKNLVNVSEITGFIDAEIYAQQNPVVEPINTPLPWA